MLAGVCAGIADYFSLDPTVVRMLAVLLTVIGSGAPVLAYVVMWIVVPEAPLAGATGGGGSTTMVDQEGWNSSGITPNAPEPPQPPGDSSPAVESPGVATATAPPPPPPPPSRIGASASDWGRRDRRGGGGVWFGIVLVLIGALVISGRFFEGFAWWEMWPLIIVLAGAIQAVTPGREGWGIGRLFDGLSGIVFGLVLLGNTTGFLSWSVWWRIMTMWPVLLIAIGFSVLARGLDQQWLRAFGSIAVIAAVAWAAATSISGSPAIWYGTSAGAPFSVDEPADSRITEGTFEFKGGAGEIRVESGSALFAAEGETVLDAPDYRSDVSSTTADIMLDLGQRGTVVVPNARGNYADIELSRDVAWDVSIDTGVSQLTADLSDVNVVGLFVTTGVSSADVKLGELSGTGDVEVTVKSGISSVDIRIPESAEVSVRSMGGLAALDLDRGIERVDVAGERFYKTAGFDNARRRYVIEVETGVGSVNIDRY